MNDQIFVCPIRDLFKCLVKFDASQAIMLTTSEPPIGATDFVFGVEHLHLSFEDLEDDSPSAPTIEHIKQILAFARKDTSIVCACDAGISRSSAVAIGLLCSRGMKSEDAVALAFERKNTIWPNMRILSFFDGDGSIVEACKKKKGEIIASGFIAED